MSELSSDARALIEAGRFGDEPAGFDKARVRERLVRQLGVGAFAGTGVLAVVRSAGSGGGGTLTGAPRPSPASLSDAHTLPRGVTPAAKLPLAKVAGAGASRVGASLWVKVAAFATAAGALYSGAVLLDVLPRGPQPLPALPPAEPAQPEPTLEPTTEPLIVAQAQPEAAQPEAAAEAPKETARGTSSRRARREAREVERAAEPAAAEPTPEVAPAASLTEELALLARAQRMLREDQPERALAVVHEHGERFPEGTLREERAGIEALARCVLGQRDAPSVKSFLERSPSSPLAARVRKECSR